MTTVTTYTTEQVADLARVSYRLLDRAVRLGYLQCSNPSPGSGGRRGWTEHEVDVIVRITDMAATIGLDWSAAVRLYAARCRRGETQRIVGDWGTLTLLGVTPCE